MVELESSTLLRPPYRLLTVRDGTIYEANLVWSWGRLIGLHFTAQHPIQAPAVEQTRMLRQIWSAVRA